MDKSWQAVVVSSFPIHRQALTVSTAGEGKGMVSGRTR